VLHRTIFHTLAEPRRILDKIRTLKSFTFYLIVQVCFPHLPFFTFLLPIVSVHPQTGRFS
jgi:hypothetical protein